MSNMFRFSEAQVSVIEHLIIHSHFQSRPGAYSVSVQSAVPLFEGHNGGRKGALTFMPIDRLLLFTYLDELGATAVLQLSPEINKRLFQAAMQSMFCRN